MTASKHERDQLAGGDQREPASSRQPTDSGSWPDIDPDAQHRDAGSPESTGSDPESVPTSPTSLPDPGGLDGRTSTGRHRAARP